MQPLSFENEYSEDLISLTDFELAAEYEKDITRLQSLLKTCDSFKKECSDASQDIIFDTEESILEAKIMIMAVRLETARRDAIIEANRRPKIIQKYNLNSVLARLKLNYELSSSKIEYHLPLSVEE